MTGAKTLTNPAWVKFLLYNNNPTPTIRLAAAHLLPRHAPRRDHRAPRRQPAPRRAVRLGRLRAPDGGQVPLRATPRTVTTGAPSLLENINNYLKGGMFLLGGIAALVMIVILLVLFDVRWRLLPLGVIVDRPDLGLRHGRLPAHPPHPGHHRRAARDAGRGHRLRHPDAGPRRGGGGRSTSAEHPIQETATNLCPALLVVTFDAVFAFSALYFAKVPMIRQFGALLAVGIVDDLPVLASCCRWPRSASASTSRRRCASRSKRSEALGRLVVQMGGLPTRSAVPADRGQPARLLRRHPGRGQAHAADRPGAVGQPALPGHPQHQRARAGHRLGQRAGRVRPGPGRVHRRRGRARSTCSPPQPAQDQRRQAGHRDQHRGHRSATSINDVPGANHVVPTGTEVHDAYLVAPGDLQRHRPPPTPGP